MHYATEEVEEEASVYSEQTVRTLCVALLMGISAGLSAAGIALVVSAAVGLANGQCKDRVGPSYFVQLNLKVCSNCIGVPVHTRPA